MGWIVFNFFNQINLNSSPHLIIICTTTYLFQCFILQRNIVYYYVGTYLFTIKSGMNNNYMFYGGKFTISLCDLWALYYYIIICVCKIVQKVKT